jgi:hypothetical protein
MQMALVLLCRLLSWLHLGSVVAPGSSDCLHFVLVMVEAQAGKASLFQQLVAAPPEYAGQLGGSGTSCAPVGLGSGGVTSRSGELKVIAGQQVLVNFTARIWSTLRQKVGQLYGSRIGVAGAWDWSLRSCGIFLALRH